MPRPDPALLESGRYPFQTEIATRFADLDVYQHLNNVAIVELIETGRVLFHRASGFAQAIGDGLGAMVASLAVEYLAQGYFPEPVTMHVGALKIGRSSYTVAQLLRQNGRPIAYAQGVIVCVQDGTPVALPEAYIAEVRRWMIGV